jgi:hypothetical protein
VNRAAAVLALSVIAGGIGAGAGAGAANAQTPLIQLRDAGPGEGPELLARELARPYRVVAPAGTRYTLARDSTFSRTVIVLGRDVVVEGKVHGDVVVIAGDLYMHPGGVIDGRSIAIGGGVYESTLASIAAGPTTFGDFTYAIAPTASGFALDYQPFRTGDDAALTWPGFYGFRLPTYDRSNGLSLRAGPRYQIPHTGLIIAPTAAYRSQLGRIDPSIVIVDSLGRRTSVQLVAERSTLSNDEWIWSDLVNSAGFIAAGEDARNYYRASRAELTVGRRWETANGELAPFVGALVERARSVRPGFDADGGPWTLFGRHDRDDALRPNPAIDAGTTSSGIAGARWRWEDSGISAHGAARLELGRTDLDCAGCDAVGSSSFGQLTMDAGVGFPTFGSQSVTVFGHGVLSSLGAVPRQRFVYLGGGGTLPTLDMLSLGGDELLYLDFRYNIPIERVEIPFVGPPVVTLREAVGGVDIGRFPTLHQAAGVRLSGGFLYVEYLVDPAARRGHAGFGISLRR